MYIQEESATCWLVKDRVRVSSGSSSFKTRGTQSGCSEQGKKSAVVLDFSGILTKACHIHFIKTSGNCVSL